MNQLVQLIKKSLFLLVFFVFSNSFGQAGNLNNDIGVFAAADMGYECLGNGNYKVSLEVYAECGYFDGYLASRDNYLFVLESKKLNFYQELRLLKPLTSPEREGLEVEIYCPEKQSQCETKDKNSLRGLTKYVFSETFPLDQFGKTDDWKIYWSRNNRSAEINTIKDKQQYHTEASINNTSNVCNSTPKIGAESVFGIKQGIADTIQLGANDPNGNQLKYSIVSPLQGLNDPIDYKAGISASQPFGEGKTITINNSGRLIIPAINEAEVKANFDVLIEEFNGNTKVGESRKAFQITTLETENTAPAMSGINETENTSITICAGDNLNFQIKGSDADGNKARFVFRPIVNPNKNISFSGSFSYSNNPVLNVSWATTPLDTGTYTIRVTIEDDACPVKLSSIREFTIRVNPIPNFTLGPNEPFNCNVPQEFDPEISNAVGNLSYSWSRWFVRTSFPRDTVDTPFQTEKKLELTGPGQFLLEVSDDAGCSRSDRVIIYESLVGSMSFYNRCIGQTTTFEDLSTFNGSSFVQRLWTIETKTETTDLETFQHTFPGLGSYDAQLIVEDDLGCIDTIDRVVEVVEEPEAAVSLIDSCSAFLNGTYERGGVDFIDASIYQSGDGFGDVEWTISTLAGDELDVLVPPQPNGFTDRWFDYGFPDSGLYIIKTEINTSASCQASKVDTVHIVQRPQLKLISDSVYSINCANPTTVFQVTLDDYYTGTSGYDFWYFNPDSAKSEITSFNDSKTILSIDTDTTLGTYTYWVKDSKGCEHFQTVEVVFSTDAALGYELQCSEGEIQFRDLSTIDTTDRTIVNWNWEFGDGKFSNLQEPSHLYDQQGAYTSVLTIEDSKGCTSSDSLMVYYSFPVSNLKILAPNLDFIKLCDKNTINLENDLNLDFNVEYNINSIIWRFIYANGDTVPEYYPVVDFDGQRKWITKSHQLQDTTTNLLIEHEFTFNGNPENVTAEGQTCSSLERLNKPLKIFPEFDGKIVDNRVCIGDSAIFQFYRDEETRDILIDSARWTFRNASNQIVKVLDEIEPSLYISTEEFRRLETVGGEVRLVDINGCVVVKPIVSLVQKVEADFELVFDTVGCKNENILFQVYSDQGNIDEWQINKYYSDSLTGGGHFGVDLATRFVSDAVIRFDELGRIPISLFMQRNQEDDNEVENEIRSLCRARVDTFIYINDVPTYDITSDVVCSAVSATTFTNNSTINGDFGKVIDYRWDFGDGSEQVITPAGQIEVKHRYKDGGKYNVIVSATTEEQCNQSSDTVEVEVRPTPIARYETDQEFLEAGELITFTDVSETFGASKDSIFWDFGYPGKFVNQEIVTVEWDTVNIYQVYHYIRTSDGCEDDTLYRIDLNTYLDLPNAFSPNNDGTNDELFLIYKSIEELYTYKIYNRWGQEIFDAEGDLTRGWDGTYNGTDQEVGVYVAHVKARGAYDTAFNFKVNVRLIR